MVFLGFCLLIQEIGNQLRSKFEGYEIPRKLAFVNEEWTIENGLLTQTLKLKRRLIQEKYKDLIAKLY